MKNQKGFIVPLLIAIVALVAVGGGIYFYSQKNKQVAIVPATATDVSSGSQTSTAFDDSDLRISATRIPDSSNSAAAFSAIASNAISTTDQSFITKYLGSYSLKNLPPVAQSQKIISTYSSLLGIFNANANKQYQCLLSLGDTCSLQPIRNVANLAGLQALTLFQQNQSSQAQSTAANVVALGKSVTANADSIITLLVGWSVQNLGYNIVSTVGPKGTLSASDKASLIATLRQEQKNALRFEYTKEAELIDYITSPNNKPSIAIDSDTESLIDTYRQGAATSPTAWNPTETKKYFYDSYKIALSNVDLACGATPTTSTLNLNFNPQDQQAENYVGKTLYSTAYASLDSMSQKRCQIETLIQNL